MGNSTTNNPETQHKKWAKIPEEWRMDMLSRKPEDIRAEIVRVAMNMIALEIAKEEDEDLAALQEQLATARAIYTDGKKDGRTKLEFLREVLKGQGQDVPEASDFLKATPDAKTVAGVKAKVAEAFKDAGFKIGEGGLITLDADVSAEDLAARNYQKAGIKTAAELVRDLTKGPG